MEYVYIYIYIYVCSHIECFYGAIEHQSAAEADVDEVPVLPRSSGETILPMEGPTPPEGRNQHLPININNIVYG